MAVNNVSLSSAMRSNLISLQGTVKLLNQTQDRLATGLKVNSALDNPASYFAARALTDRAFDLGTLNDGMNTGIQTLKAADAGIEGITTLIESAKGLAQAAYTASDTSDLTTQYNQVRTQIDDLVGDSGYNGINLLEAGDELLVTFEGASASLNVSSVASTTGALEIDAAAFSSSASIGGAITQLDAALATIRSTASTFSSNLNIITARQEFTNNMINTLTEGADHLTLADMNEEAANMLMLQTRQALGTTALSISSQAAQSVLRLF